MIHLPFTHPYTHTRTYIYIYNKKEREREGVNIIMIYRKRLMSKCHCFIPGKRVGQTNFPAKSLHLLYNIYIYMVVRNSSYPL